MGCHQKALDRYADSIRRDPANADHFLDQMIDATTLATNWDAGQWGFDPDRWMAVERCEMDRRANGAGLWPKENV